MPCSRARPPRNRSQTLAGHTVRSYASSSVRFSIVHPDAYRGKVLSGIRVSQHIDIITTHCRRPLRDRNLQSDTQQQANGCRGGDEDLGELLQTLQEELAGFNLTPQFRHEIDARIGIRNGYPILLEQLIQFCILIHARLGASSTISTILPLRLQLYSPALPALPLRVA